MQESNRNGACTLIVEVEACTFSRLKLNESQNEIKQLVIILGGSTKMPVQCWLPIKNIIWGKTQCQGVLEG